MLYVKKRRKIVCVFFSSGKQNKFYFVIRNENVLFYNILHISDDTYMYDDAARGALGRNNQGHWYDEPPYESDPDDFLMSGMGPAATIQVCLLFPHIVVPLFSNCI